VSEEAEVTNLGPLDIRRVMAALPHRYPLLLVDRVESLDPESGIVAIKAVTINEQFFQGHFPGRPIMPGVLQVEALAQVGAVCGLSHPGFRGKLALFAGIDDVRFKRIVTPGDVLTLDCRINRLRGPIGKADATASVDGELACRAALTFALTELDQ